MIILFIDGKSACNVKKVFPSASIDDFAILLIAPKLMLIALAALIILHALLVSRVFPSAPLDEHAIIALLSMVSAVVVRMKRLALLVIMDFP